MTCLMCSRVWVLGDGVRRGQLAGAEEMKERQACLGQTAGERRGTSWGPGQPRVSKKCQVRSSK